ncbi:MAG TPA: Gfo/Idh/MocA family oxidoreductase, partial [Bryobacteraceae bacterium]|nr:Gfo/Idh/MocA family oxidoreductase [Bryobacteraceae bacterium]
MDRRNFLQQTGAVMLTSLTANAAIPKVRAGMLGTGHSHFSGKLKVMMESPDYEIAGIVEADPGAKARMQNDPRYSSFQWLSEEDLLKDPSIHLIVVECRAWEAVPWGSKVIAAGKHLHLEKPPGNEWGPFKDLVENARSKSLLLQTGYLWRWHQGVMAAIEAAQKGWLGEVFMVRGTMNSDRGPQERATEAHYRGG